MLSRCIDQIPIVHSTALQCSDMEIEQFTTNVIITGRLATRKRRTRMKRAPWRCSWTELFRRRSTCPRESEERYLTINRFAGTRTLMKTSPSPYSSSLVLKKRLRRGISRGLAFSARTLWTASAVWSVSQERFGRVQVTLIDANHSEDAYIFHGGSIGEERIFTETY